MPGGLSTLAFNRAVLRPPRVFLSQTASAVRLGWVAELEYDRQQQVRHDPPWTQRHSLQQPREGVLISVTIVLGHTASEKLVDSEHTARHIREVEAESVALICCETDVGGRGKAQGAVFV